MKELEILLENYWIIKDNNKELYYSIKDSISGFKSFISDKLGYHVLVNPYIIKLEKLPGKAEPWMGIEKFESTMEYAFLCLMLMFLEDKGREEQFVLSEVTEFIQGNYPGDEKVDWTLFRHRRYLIKMLRFVAEMGMIKVDDGDEQGFTNSIETEVLYESTGISRYFVRNFTMDVMNYNSYKDIEKEDFADTDTDRGIIRRHRVYRRLLMSPIVYNEDSDDADYEYIKNFRNVIANDLENVLEYNLHVHRNGSLVVLSPEKNMKDMFPGGRAISDVVLLFNSLIREKIEKGTLSLRADDSLIMSKVYFQSLVEELKINYYSGWSKEYREMSLAALEKEIIEYMQDFNMLKVIKEEREIEILPLAGKIIGKYPRDFNIAEREAAFDE